jgi:DNA-binding transcriptional regulator YiaG
MCKHVAAVLYGVGSRLDNQPELLFLLRDVDAADLIATEMALPDDEVTSDRLAEDELSDVFGIDLDTEDIVPPAAKAPRDNKATPQQPTRQRVVSAPKRQRVPAAKNRKMSTVKQPAGHAAKAAASAGRRPKASHPPAPATRAAAKGDNVSRSTFRPTGKSVARLRRQHGLSVAEFAEALGVSTTTVYRWELTPGKLNLQNRPLQALMVLHYQAKK